MPDPIHELGRLLAMRTDPALAEAPRARLVALAARVDALPTGDEAGWRACYQEASAVARDLLRALGADGEGLAPTEILTTKGAAVRKDDVDHVLRVLPNLQDVDREAVRYVLDDRLERQRKGEIDALMLQLATGLEVEQGHDKADLVVSVEPAAAASLSEQAGRVLAAWRDKSRAGLLAHVENEREPLLNRLEDSLGALGLPGPELDLPKGASTPRGPDLALSRRFPVDSFAKGIWGVFRSAFGVIFLITMVAVPLGLKRETIILPLIPIFLGSAVLLTTRSRRLAREKHVTEARAALEAEALARLRQAASETRDEIAAEIRRWQQKQVARFRDWKLDLEELRRTLDATPAAAPAAPATRRGSSYLVEKLKAIAAAIERRVAAG